MKKFISNCSLFLMPITLIIIIFEISLRNIPNDYNYKKNYLDENSKDIKYLILGSSHAYYGINPDILPKHSFNASYVSQTIDIDSKILSKYKDNLNNLNFIIVPIDYFTLFSRLKSNKEKWRIKNYNIYYKIFLSYELKDNLEILNTKLNLNLKKLKSYYLDSKSSITTSKYGFGIDIKKQKNLEESGIIAAQRHTKKLNMHYYDNLKVIDEIINIANRYDAKIIFYTSPAYKSYVSNLDKNQLKTMYKSLDKIINNNYNIYYYDFLNDNDFTENDFRDADHLNSVGSKKLTLKINRIISKIQSEN